VQTGRGFFFGALAAVVLGQPDIRAFAADIGPTNDVHAPTPCPAGLVVAGTPLVLTLDEGLSSATSKLGDEFHVTVLREVRVNGVVAVPQGAHGSGQVTFVSKRGGLGKAGILALSLRHIALGGKAFALDGHYEEDGAKRHNTAAAVWFLAGVGAVLVRGGEAVIPTGRELTARTGQAFCPPVAPPVDPGMAPDLPPVAVF
jgi:hypothetical protein